MDRLRKLLVSGFGTGYLPLAPGSWGSAAVAGAWLALCWAVKGDPVWLTGAMVLAAAGSSLVCVAFGAFAEKAYGRHDPRQMVADEWAGQAVSLLGLPVGHDLPHYAITAGAAFFVFRALDTIKPPPARQLELLPAGWGMLLDDLMAGVYANVVCQVILRLWIYAG